MTQRSAGHWPALLCSAHAALGLHGTLRGNAACFLTTVYPPCQESATRWVPVRFLHAARPDYSELWLPDTGARDDW